MVLVAANDKLAAMKKVHLVVCDLFLPADFAAKGKRIARMFKVC